MAKNRQGAIRVEFTIEPQLHRLLKATCERLQIPIRILVMDAVRERVEYLEEKRRLEDERRRAERDGSQDRAGFTAFPRLRSSTLTPPPKPMAPSAQPAATPTSVVAPTKELPIEYATYAEKIYKAVQGGDRLEVRLLTAESVAAIRAKFPLSSPKPEVIQSTLETLVLKMHEGASTASAVAIRTDAPPMTIDPSRLKTYGGTIDRSGLEGED